MPGRSDVGICITAWLVTGTPRNNRWGYWLLSMISLALALAAATGVVSFILLAKEKKYIYVE